MLLLIFSRLDAAHAPTNIAIEQLKGIANLDAGQIYVPLLTGDATVLTPFMIPHLLCAKAI